MTTQRTLRRKLQKKAKHKPYRKCPKCGARCELKLYDVDDLGNYLGWILVKSCRNIVKEDGVTMRCGYNQELFWTGGGTGRHIPPAGRPAQDSARGESAERPQGCAGSNPAPFILLIKGKL